MTYALFSGRLSKHAVLSDPSYPLFTFAHVVKEKINGHTVMIGPARLAAVNGSGNVKRLDKAIVAILQLSFRRSP